MKRVLYIEDNVDTAEAVKILLGNAGFEVEVEHCGKDGMFRMQREKFDAVLIDIMLPDMSGWDIYESIRGKFPETKYSFLSAIPVSKERLEELKNEGVSDYITKPFKKEDLINRVKKMVA
ncbi:MAG: response regulator [Candidatus Micrarchaeota archaeon]